MKTRKIMKGNKKGFTLIELIAVIVILAVIATLAIVSVSSIRSKVNEREYNNLASTIKTAAENYAEETGINKMFVQTLIDKGLIDADDESKELHDPRDNSSLNCQILNFENGEITLTESENPTCDTTLLSDEAIKIQYSLNNGESSVKNDLPNDHWFQEGITLSVAATGVVDLDLTDAEYKWASPLAPDRTYSEKELVIDNKYVDDTYQVTVTVGGRKYTAYAKVRIDKEPPKVFNFVDTKPEDWSPNKALQFELSDAESGIMGYQITFDNTNEPSTWVKVKPEGKKTDKINITKNLSSMNEGEYVYVWVKDVVGNTNVSDLSSNGEGALKIDNIDGIFDTVTLTGSPNNSTYSTEVTLSGKIQDLKSGAIAYVCSSSKNAPSKGSSQWKSITKTNNEYSVTCPTKATANGEYYLHAIDAVGNVGTATYKVENIDRSIDSVSLIDTGSGYRTSTTLKGSASDSKSGIVGYAFTTSANKPSSFTRINATNSTITYTYNANSNVQYYFHVIDGAGNWSYDYVTVENIVVERSTTMSLSSEYDDIISDSKRINGAVQITDYYIDNGYASVSLNGSYVYVTARNGYTRTGSYRSTCSEWPGSYRADSERVCSGYYYCSAGRVSGDYCYPDKGYSYELFSNPPTYQTYKCSNGKWVNTGGKWPSTSCAAGYSRSGGKDWYNCTSPSGSCTGTGTQSGYYGCYAMCYWDRNFPAQCIGGYRNQYYCDRGDILEGSTCYYCSYNSSYNYRTGMCDYSCTQYYDYWQYSVTIYYYVIK